MRAVASAALIAVLAATVHAQPAAETTARARELYRSAEAARAAGRLDEAIADYTAAYELSGEAALLFKLGTAHERAGRCDRAIEYYDRYLREGRPEERFVTLTQARIAECQKPPKPATPATPPVETPAEPTPPPPPPPAPVTTGPSIGHHQGPWLLVGGSLALLTIGGVLAYSASAAERDVDDLYVGLTGQPPVFDAGTQAQYEALIDEGERYQRLARVSFAVGGAMAVGAAVWFWLDRDKFGSERARVAPVVGARGAGMVVRF